MPNYHPFLIAPFKTGYTKELESWLAPMDAFPTLLDGRVHKGVLEKRRGSMLLADTGAGLPIVGIHASMQHGHPVYLVADTEHVYKYDPFAQTFTDLTVTLFTGTDRDLFWFTTWRDAAYMTNGVDPIHVWREFPEKLVKLDTGPVKIDTCRMIFRFKNRLLFVSPVIEGKWRPNTLLYTDVNMERVSDHNWVYGDFDDVLTTGCMVNREPVLFGHDGAIVKVRYTGDSDAPFTLEEVTRDAGVLGPFPPPIVDEGAFLVGHARLLRYDGMEFGPVDGPVRGIVGDMDRQWAWRVSAAARKDERRIYLAYPAAGQTDNDRLLEIDIDEGAYAVHRLDVSCLHTVAGHITVTDEDLSAIVGDGFGNIPLTDLHILRHPLYGAMTLAGGHDGQLTLLDYGDTDSGQPVTMEAWTGAVNPFAQAGRKVRFGKCRMLVDSHAAAKFTVAFHKDLTPTPYKTTEVSCNGPGAQHWVTLFPDGEVGNFHRLAITDNEPAARSRIHAILLEMAPAGKLDAGVAGGVHVP